MSQSSLAALQEERLKDLPTQTFDEAQSRIMLEPIAMRHDNNADAASYVTDDPYLTDSPELRVPS